jgi:hypothetical protein
MIYRSSLEQMQKLGGLLVARSEGLDRSNSSKIQLCFLVASLNKSDDTKRR